MADGTKSGLAHGTSGSPQLTLENGKMAAKAKENEDHLNNSNSILIEELEKAGVKFTRNNIVFITRDRSEQIIWLETGNCSAGLQHILQRHENDFVTKHNINKSEIAAHLKTVLSKGQIVYSRPKMLNNGQGVERLYQYKSKYYILTGIGTNGFIVSAYPIDDAVAAKLKGRYGK